MLLKVSFIKSVRTFTIRSLWTCQPATFQLWILKSFWKINIIISIWTFWMKKIPSEIPKMWGVYPFMIFSISFLFVDRKPGPWFHWDSFIPFLLIFPFKYLAWKLWFSINDGNDLIGRGLKCFIRAEIYAGAQWWMRQSKVGMRQIPGRSLKLLDFLQFLFT